MGNGQGSNTNPTIRANRGCFEAWLPFSKELNKRWESLQQLHEAVAVIRIERGHDLASCISCASRVKKDTVGVICSCNNGMGCRANIASPERAERRTTEW